MNLSELLTPAIGCTAPAPVQSAKPPAPVPEAAVPKKVEQVLAHSRTSGTCMSSTPETGEASTSRSDIWADIPEFCAGQCMVNGSEFYTLVTPGELQAQTNNSNPL